MEAKGIETITIWQPWASLCVAGIKPFETRSWATNYRGRIAIHAAAKPMDETMRFLPSELISKIYAAFWKKGIMPEQVDNLPTGAVVGTVEIARCLRVEQQTEKLAILVGENSIVSVSGLELQLGDFSVGRYAWELLNPVMFDKPIKAVGHLGIWKWEGNTYVN